MENHYNTILIVEDDAGLVELISEKVIESGHQCKSFTIASEAINWLTKNIPLLIILDYSLPDLNALEFISTLKTKGIALPPFIVATGRGDERIAVELMKKGSRDYVVKDSNFLEMINVVIDRTIKDICTEINLKQTREELEELSKFNNQIIECAHEGVVVYDKELRYVVWNKFMEEITGYKSEEVIGKYILEIFPFLEEKGIYKNVTDALTVEIQSENEFFFCFEKKQKSAWVSNITTPLRNKQNEVIGVISAVHNITGRKNAENYLLQSKTALHKLVEFSTGLIESSTDNIDFEKITNTIQEISGSSYAFFNLFQPNHIDFRTVGLSGILKFSSISMRFLGFDVMKKKWKQAPYKTERTKNKPITKFESLTDLTKTVIKPQICSLIEKTFNLGDVYIVKISKNNISIGDFTLVYKKGKTILNPEIIEIYANQVGLYIERQRADILMKDSEKKYRVLFADHPQPMLIYDLKTLKILEVNKKIQSHYGYTRKEFLSMDITNLHSTDELDSILDKIERTRKGEKTDGVSKHVKKDGTEIFVETNTIETPSFGENARQVIINDITLRKIAEDNLKTSFSLLNATLESTADGILVVDKNGIATTYNQRFAQMWNIPKEIMNEKLDEQLLRYVLTLMENPEDFINKVSYLYKNPELSSIDLIKLNDGRTFERFSLPQWVDSEIKGRVWSFRDISHRLKADEEIKEKIEEMTRFHKLTVGRELTMIDLKKEINELYRKSGKKEKYKIVE